MAATSWAAPAPLSAGVVLACVLALYLYRSAVGVLARRALVRAPDEHAPVTQTRDDDAPLVAGRRLEAPRAGHNEVAKGWARVANQTFAHPVEVRFAPWKTTSAAQGAGVDVIVRASSAAAATAALAWVHRHQAVAGPKVACFVTCATARVPAVRAAVAQSSVGRDVEVLAPPGQSDPRTWALWHAGERPWALLVEATGLPRTQAPLPPLARWIEGRREDTLYLLGTGGTAAKAKPTTWWAQLNVPVPDAYSPATCRPKAALVHRPRQARDLQLAQALANHRDVAAENDALWAAAHVLGTTRVVVAPDGATFAASP